ncbi:hypothetical protein MVEN_01708200 [Mycena venus]|uniref:CCHC-type domain-containing protein n=1 Tax=Mycena venus TaxID=2733690 RepID=A0A8H6XM30_9AGAR|nr:hypothetical protein MVEN_01708200 [Mycena venus]
MPPAAQAEIDAWQKHEDESRNHLAQKLEDTTFLQADEYDTVAEMWEWISNEFTALSVHAVAAMQAEFDSCNCGEHGNVRTHLELLKMKHKGLVAVGVALLDSQYATRIINSLPRYYQRYLSTITSSAKAALIATNIARTVAAATQAAGTTPAPGLTIASGNSASTQAITLAPTYLMHLAVEEWDRIEAEKKRNTPSKSREDTGVALSAQSSASSSLSQSHRSRSGESSGNGNGNGNRRSMPVCWNCGGKGHVKSQCPSPKLKGSDTAGKQDASERVDAVEEFDDEGAFSVEHVECIDTTHFAGLLRVAAGTAVDAGDICDDGEDVLAASPTSVSFNSDVDSRVGEFCGNVLPDIWPELPDASGFSLDFVLERNHAPLSLDCPESDYDWDDTMPDLSEVEVSDDEGDPDVYGYPLCLA